MDPEIEKKLQEVVRRLVTRFQPVKIILFGSYARGTANKESDIDLLVVSDAEGKTHKLAALMYQELGSIGIPKDIVVVKPETVDTYRDLPGTIIYPAFKEGKVLYERAA